MILRVFYGLICILAAVAAFYLEHYTGRLIPYPFLWRLLMYGVTLGAAYLFFSTYRMAAARQMAQLDQEREARKQHCEVVVVDLAGSEIKARGYVQEVESAYTGKAEMYDGLYDPSRNYKTESVQQTVLVYRYPETHEKFISQSFAVDETTLKNYVITGKMRLYIDRFDRNQYWFEVVPD